MQPTMTRTGRCVSVVLGRARSFGSSTWFELYGTWKADLYVEPFYPCLNIVILNIVMPLEALCTVLY